jgi:hypothetical protein
MKLVQLHDLKPFLHDKEIIGGLGLNSHRYAKWKLLHKYGWWKLNVDGSSPGGAGCGGVTSDYLGSWCCRVSSCIGSATNWLLSCGGLIWEGISLAKDNGCPSSS